MKNWTIKEALDVIRKGEDVEAVKEIGSRYPLFAMAAALNSLYHVALLMGDEFTLDRLMAEPEDEKTEGDSGCPIEGNMNDPEEAEDGELDPKALEALSVKDLMALCDERGIKIPHFGKAKKFYIDKLMAGAGGAAEEKKQAEEDEPEDWGDEPEEKKDPYDGKSARELHAMCKERGIKADIKKPAKFYLDLLKKDDEKKAKEDEKEDPDDDWGEEPEEKPTKVTKTSDQKKVKAQQKQEPKKAPAEDDDDWNI